MKNARPLQVETSANGHRNSTSIFVFPDIPNERELRVLHALNMHAEISREQLDRIAGASNSPDIVFRLRGRGIGIVCRMVRAFDRDGNEVQHGMYSMSAISRQAFRDWLNKCRGEA